MINKFDNKTLGDLVEHVNRKMLFRAIFSLTLGFLIKIPLIFVCVAFSPLLLLDMLVNSTDPGYTITQCCWELIKNQILAFRVVKNCNFINFIKQPIYYNDKLTDLNFEEVFLTSSQDSIIESICNEKKGIWHTTSYIIIKDVLSLEIIPKDTVVWTYLYKEKDLSYFSRFGTPYAVYNHYSVIFKTCNKKTYVFNYQTNGLNLGRSSLSLFAFQDEIYEIMFSCKNAIVGYKKFYKPIYRKYPKQFKNLIEKVDV